MTNYKVGDIVKIRPHEIENNCSSGCPGMTEEMEEYIGKTAEIIRINGRFFRLNIDDNKWDWGNCMLEPDIKWRYK